MKKPLKKIKKNCRIDRLLESVISTKPLNKLTVAEQSLCTGASNILNHEIKFRKCDESLDVTSLIDFCK